jgi:hypothetical protein
LGLERGKVCLDDRPLGQSPPRKNLGSWALGKKRAPLGVDKRPLEKKIKLFV